jgi:hypothetical protein
LCAAHDSGTETKRWHIPAKKRRVSCPCQTSNHLYYRLRRPDWCTGRTRNSVLHITFQGQSGVSSLATCCLTAPPRQHSRAVHIPEKPAPYGTM